MLAAESISTKCVVDSWTVTGIRRALWDVEDELVPVLYDAYKDAAELNKTCDEVNDEPPTQVKHEVPTQVHEVPGLNETKRGRGRPVGSCKIKPTQPPPPPKPKPAIWASWLVQKPKPEEAAI